MKKILGIVFLTLLFCNLGIAQKNEYYLSSHILDIDKGKPAPNVRIELYNMNKSGDWEILESRYTDTNGRVKDFLEKKASFNPEGIYKLKYYTADYFNKNKIESFYPYIEVIFKISDKSHYHVPITLSPFGYSTYRGS